MERESTSLCVADGYVSLLRTACCGRLVFVARLSHHQANAVRRNVDDAEDVWICDDARSDAESDTKVDDVANKAVVAPSRSPPTVLDINAFHACVGHVHEPLLSVTAKSMGIKLTGTLHSCEGCLAARGIRKPIPKQTATRADKRLSRIFADLSGPKETRALGGKRYVIVFRDDLSRYMWTYFLS